VTQAGPSLTVIYSYLTLLAVLLLATTLVSLLSLPSDLYLQQILHLSNLTDSFSFHWPVVAKLLASLLSYKLLFFLL
jgi:hypothetical protein